MVVGGMGGAAEAKGSDVRLDDNRKDGGMGGTTGTVGSGGGGGMDGSE